MVSRYSCRKRILLALLVILSLLVNIVPQISPSYAASQVMAKSKVNLRSGPGTTYKIIGSVTKGEKLTVIKSAKDWYNIRKANGVTGWVAGWLVSPLPASPTQVSRGNGPVVNTVVVKGTSVNIRSGPGTDYRIMEKTVKGKQFPLLKKEKGWYQIQLSSGRTGWIIESLVSLQSSSSQTPAPVPKPSPVTSPSPVTQPAPVPAEPIPTNFEKKVIITGSNVNVRSGPGTAYPILATVAKNKEFGYISENGGWYKIALNPEKTGWVIASLAKAVPVGNILELTAKKVDGGIKVTLVANMDLTYTRQEVPTKNSLVLTVPGLALPQAGQSLTVNDGGLKTVKAQQGATGAEIVLEFDRLGYYMVVQPDAKTIEVLIPTPEPAPVPVDNSTPTYQLGEVKAEVPGDDETRVIIQGNGPITFNKQYLKNPDRLVLDLANYEPGQALELLAVNSPLVNQVRVSQFSTVPKVTRVVLDLAKPCGYTISQSFDQTALTISLSSKGILVGKKIVVDPGHGDWDPGAIGAGGLKEKEVNLDTANRLVQYLQALGAEVMMTRSDDTFVPLATRAEIANNWGADVFVSIHSNSNTNPAITGTSTYYYAPTDRPDLADQLDKRKNLAQAVQTEMIKAVGRRNIGILQAKFAVLSATRMPSILVEMAFLSNPEEEALLADEANRDKFAEAIARGIVNYFQNMP